MLGFWSAYREMAPVSLWLTLLVLGPVMWQWLSEQGPRCLHAAHTIEAGVVPALLWWLDMHGIAMAFAGIAGLCNVALWGPVSVPAAISACTLILLSIENEIALEWLFFGAGLAGFAAIVHGQACLQLSRKAALKMREADILRFLPRDFDVRSLHEHRREWLTVAFIDLGGFTRAVETLSPEMTRDLLNEFLGHVTSEVESASGSVSKFLGDGVLCVFAGNDFDTRSRAASVCVSVITDLAQWIPEFNERWRKLGCALRFHLTAGVASGHCSMGDWGVGRLDFTVIGTPVNLAHRLQSVVQTGDVVLIDEVTSELLAGEVGLSRTEPLELKGLSSRVAYRPVESLLQKA